MLLLQRQIRQGSSCTAADKWNLVGGACRYCPSYEIQEATGGRRKRKLIVLMPELEALQIDADAAATAAHAAE